VAELTKSQPTAQTKSRLRVQLPHPRPLAELANSSYSSFVGTMKILLPAIMVGIVLLVVAWPRFKAHEEGFHLTMAKISPEDIDNLRMVNPRYQGIDKRGEPFTVTATMATKEKSTSDVVELEKPVADITLTRGTWVELKGDYGAYREQDQQLDLVGSVYLYQDEGYEFRTLAAHFNLANNTAEGDDPVDCQWTAGQVTSQGFRIYDKGARILFTGKSHLVLRPQGAADGDTTEGLPSFGPAVTNPKSKGSE